MTREEAIKMLKAKLECMTRDVSGYDDDCNRKLCGECHLNYEQGNMGEQKEYLRMSIEALEQEPCEDCIKRSDACFTDFEIVMCNGDYKEALRLLTDKIEKAPSVIPQPKEITFDDVQKYCRARCLTIITDELLFELTHTKLLPQKSEGKE